MAESPTDVELLERIRDSDIEAFRCLFERYQPVVFRNTSFQTGDTDLSHDIVQETFLRVWEHRQSLKPQLSFLAYAFRISGNIVRDTVRHRKTREKVNADLPGPANTEGDNPEEALQKRMLEERLVETIRRKLPERCRAIFIMSRFEEKTHQEIADLFHISIRTVEHQVSHALKVIRRNLRDYT